MELQKKNKYNIVFSIAVHEKYEIILEQVYNINHFNENCLIVLHFSKSFINNSLISKEKFYEEINRINNVVVNPNSYQTNAYSMLLVHYSNFEYAKKTIDFEYFSIINSNDIFIKNGLYEKIIGSDCFLEERKLTKRWSHYNNYLRDNETKMLLNNIDVNVSFLEGTCYSYEVFSDVCSTLSSLDLTKMKYYYPVEEVVIPSLALHISKKNIYGRAIQNGIGPLFVNNRIIKKTAKSKVKYGFKRIDRDFYNYQRIYLRKKYLNYIDIYSLLGLKEKNMSLAKYYFIDFWCSVYKQLSYVKTRIKHFFNYIFK